jgi:acyl-CoA thioesterase
MLMFGFYTTIRDGVLRILLLIGSTCEYLQTSSQDPLSPMAYTKSLYGSLSEILSFRTLGDAKWETNYPPQRMGNVSNIAYGGFAIAVAAQAACKSVPEGYHMYTLMGDFLGPAFTDRPLRASTRLLRKTRTFATCQIEVTQVVTSKEGKQEERACLVALGDFQVQEKGNVLEYSLPPRQ